MQLTVFHANQSKLKLAVQRDNHQTQWVPLSLFILGFSFSSAFSMVSSTESDKGMLFNKHDKIRFERKNSFSRKRTLE